MKVILEEYLQGIAAAGERIERCEEAMRDLLESWRLAPAVRALMAMKGFRTVAAMILISELGEVETPPGPHHQVWQRPCPVVIGGVCPALRQPTQSLQGTEPASARAISSGAGHQLARAEPVASSLHAPLSAATPA